jgi:hypothetical protein
MQSNQPKRVFVFHCDLNGIDQAAPATRQLRAARASRACAVEQHTLLIVSRRNRPNS